MRVLVIIKDKVMLILDSPLEFDPVDKHYVGELAVGGTVIIPRENLTYTETWSDRMLDSSPDSFRLKLDRMKAKYETDY
jgi:hypothetical protein